MSPAGRRVTLASGESRAPTVAIDTQVLQTFVEGLDGARDFWNLAQGNYDLSDPPRTVPPASGVFMSNGAHIAITE